MKKFIFTLLLVCSLGFIVGCTSCKKEPAVNDLKVAELTVENTIAVDREYMFLNYGADYRWYEAQVLLNNFLDEENDGSIAEITNVFQAIVHSSEDGQSFDTQVIMITHNAEGTDVVVKDGFWIEDYSLTEEVIAVTYAEAYEKVLEANYPKPHSRHCVLRSEIGPKSANDSALVEKARENLKYQLYVDAVTGAVTDKSPAFDGFGKPLGEWP